MFLDKYGEFRSGFCTQEAVWANDEMTHKTRLCLEWQSPSLWWYTHWLTWFQTKVSSKKTSNSWPSDIWKSWYFPSCCAEVLEDFVVTCWQRCQLNQAQADFLYWKMAAHAYVGEGWRWWVQHEKSPEKVRCCQASSPDCRVPQIWPFMVPCPGNRSW